MRPGRATAALLAIVGAAGVARAEPGDAALQHTIDRIRAAPREAAGFGDLAGWLFRRGDLGRARAAAEEAVRLEPGSAPNHRLLGYVAAAAGAGEEAESAFRRAADLDPASHASLADFHLAQAWAGYQEALRRSGPKPDLLERLREIAAAAEVNPELRTLLRGGWAEEPEPPREAVPPILLGDGISTALVVEKKTQTVRLYGRVATGVALLKTYPCTTGQALGAKHERGDLRTPDGVYFFSDLFPGDRLPSRYGALAMPLDYPNAWDRRAGRNGHGIWFHGSDRLASPFTPRDTEGCVLMRNEDLLELAGLIEPLTTPVLIAEEVPDRPAAEWQALVNRLSPSAEDPRPAAVIAAPEYVLLLRRDGPIASYEFLPAAGDGLRYTVALPPRAEWEGKLRRLQPDYTASLERVIIAGDENRVVIETSAPAKARVFRAELAHRLYLDLPGVRSAPVPESHAGAGLVERVRVSAVAIEPPLTRVVIDLTGDAGSRVESAGNHISVSFDSPERSAARAGDLADRADTAPRAWRQPRPSRP